MLICAFLLMEPDVSRYQKRGFVFGYISHYEGMETGDIVARVVEGRVNKVNVVHVDDEGNLRKAKGEVSPDIILRELPFKVFITSLSCIDPACLACRLACPQLCFWLARLRLDLQSC